MVELWIKCNKDGIYFSQSK